MIKTIITALLLTTGIKAPGTVIATPAYDTATIMTANGHVYEVYCDGCEVGEDLTVSFITPTTDPETWEVNDFWTRDQKSELGTVEKIEGGKITLKTESGKRFITEGYADYEGQEVVIMVDQDGSLVDFVAR